MEPLNRNQVALSLGSFLAFWHLVWSILLVIGLAKPFLDFLLSLHHISLSYSIMPFSLGKAASLVLVTFIAGYILGWVFATGWNMAKKH